MKKYEKDNQVYTVQEGSELEIQLIADGFEEKKEEKDSVSDPYSKLTKKDLAALLEKGNVEE